jgi:hypothetical protein
MATEADIEFMTYFESNRKKGLIKDVRNYASNLAGGVVGAGVASLVAGSHLGSGKYAADSYLPPRVHPNPPMRINTKKAGDGKTALHRVKPFPDPSRLEVETKWLSDEEMEREAWKPSKHWVEAGSGSVGKYYVEVIGCDGLPNMDFSVTGRDKSDPFVCLVYEDCVVNTDVINGKKKKRKNVFASC